MRKNLTTREALALLQLVGVWLMIGIAALMALAVLASLATALWLTWKVLPTGRRPG